MNRQMYSALFVACILVGMALVSAEFTYISKDNWDVSWQKTKDYSSIQQYKLLITNNGTSRNFNGQIYINNTQQSFSNVKIEEYLMTYQNISGHREVCEDTRALNGSDNGTCYYVPANSTISKMEYVTRTPITRGALTLSNKERYYYDLGDMYFEPQETKDYKISIYPNTIQYNAEIGIVEQKSSSVFHPVFNNSDYIGNFETDISNTSCDVVNETIMQVEIIVLVDDFTDGNIDGWFDEVIGQTDRLSFSVGGISNPGSLKFNNSGVSLASRTIISKFLSQNFTTGVLNLSYEIRINGSILPVSDLNYALGLSNESPTLLKNGVRLGHDNSGVWFIESTPPGFSGETWDTEINFTVRMIYNMTDFTFTSFIGTHPATPTTPLGSANGALDNLTVDRIRIYEVASGDNVDMILDNFLILRPQNNCSADSNVFNTGANHTALTPFFNCTDCSYNITSEGELFVNVTSGETLNLSVAPTDGNNTFFWNFSGNTPQAGITQGFNITFSFILLPNATPSSFNLTTPINDSTETEGDIVFTWQNSTDSDNDTITYTFFIFNLTNSSNITLVNSSVTSFTTIIQTLTPSLYLWNVTVTDGLNTNFSAQSFVLTVEVAVPPFVPNVSIGNFTCLSLDNVCIDGIFKCQLGINQITGEELNDASAFDIPCSSLNIGNPALKFFFFGLSALFIFLGLRFRLPIVSGALITIGGIIGFVISAGIFWQFPTYSVVLIFIYGAFAMLGVSLIAGVR